MSQFGLARAKIEEILDYSVLSTQFENESEQRRLKTSNPILGFKIETPPLTKTQYQVYRTFFVGKYGSLTSFTFMNPFDDTEYNVRFVQGSFRGTFRSGYYVAKFEFKMLSPV